MSEPEHVTDFPRLQCNLMLRVSESSSMSEPEHVTDFPRLQCNLMLRVSASSMSLTNECTSLVYLMESGRLSPFFHCNSKASTTRRVSVELHANNLLIVEPTVFVN